MKAKAIVVSEHGGPEVLKLVEVDVADPGPDEVRIRNHAIGLNFIDIYFRTGLYPAAAPHGLGFEGAGVVDAVGANVKFLKEGDRVAYGQGPLGAYAEARVMPPAMVVRLPKKIGFDDAAAAMLKGLTVQYLFRQTYRLQGGEKILFHAAAGGVGLIACQWLKHVGATIIGTVGSDEKAELARAHGCTHTINYRKEDFAERVKELTGGKGVPVVFDGVGRDTFDISLDCLRPRGLMVNFGNASGAPPPLDLQVLALKGSLFITRPTMLTYTATTEELRQSSDDLFARMQSGDVRVEIHQRYPLADVEQAHRDLEGRRTTGSSVILP